MKKLLYRFALAFFSVVFFVFVMLFAVPFAAVTLSYHCLKGE